MSEEDFSTLLGDDLSEIQRINVDKREEIKAAADRVNVSTRRRHAEVFSEGEADPLESAQLSMLKPMDLLSFQRSGVQHGVFKNLRLGKYSIDAVLDLHRMSVEQARRALYGFIQDCLDNDVRTAMITHGKGEGRETPALLKSCVAHWLPQIDDVMAFHTAQKYHGSYGATYVLLRKSAKNKLKNKLNYTGDK